MVLIAIVVVVASFLACGHLSLRIHRQKEIARQIKERIAWPRHSGRPDEWLLQDVWDMANAIDHDREIRFQQPYDRPKQSGGKQ